MHRHPHIYPYKYLYRIKTKILTWYKRRKREETTNRKGRTVILTRRMWPGKVIC